MLEGLRAIDLMNLNLKKLTWVRLSMFGGSASPFIEEGDGFTSEREIEGMDVSKPCCPHRWGWDNGGHL